MLEYLAFFFGCGVPRERAAGSYSCRRGAMHGFFSYGQAPTDTRGDDAMLPCMDKAHGHGSASLHRFREREFFSHFCFT